MTTHSGDQTEHLLALGKKTPNVPTQGPSSDIFEAFPNKFPHRKYIVSVEFPEFTSLCPVTGQPDFATIVLEFIPDQLCVESKSLKLYMFAYRNHQSFMESITNTILEDVIKSIDPLWCRVKGLFTPRGGTKLHVFAEHYKNIDAEQKIEVRTMVNEWKQEANRHNA